MKKITCKKPCNIGGERFAIGDDVPVELVAPGREAALVKYGLISVENVPEAPSAPVSSNAPDGGADGLQQPPEGQQNGDKVQQPEDNGEDDQKEPEKSDADDTDAPDGCKKKTGKKVKE